LEVTVVVGEGGREMLMIGEFPEFVAPFFPPGLYPPERVRFSFPVNDCSESAGLNGWSFGSGLAATAVAGSMGRRYSAICVFFVVEEDE